MFTIRWVVRVRNFTGDVEKIPGWFAEASAQAHKDAQPLFDENVRKEPPPLTDDDYPLAWTSLRQARFVKRKLRLEGNLPYRRSHLLATSWQFLYRQHRFSAEFEMNNTDPKASYVFGRSDLENPTQDQQRFHAINGWKTATPEVQRIGRFIAEQTARHLTNRLRSISSG
mgnify:FL=1